MDRRTLLLATAGVAAAGFAGWRYTTRPKPRPRGDFSGSKKSGLNILFILSDQERAWDLYPQGYIETHCPGRTRLLERGTYIDGAHTPIQLCSMSRGVIYTGVHSQNNGVWENVPIPIASDLSTELPTLGSLMQDAGYRTGYAGKWHLTKLHPHNVPLPKEKVNEIVRSYGFDESETRWERDGAGTGFREDGMTVDESLRFIERNKDGDQPWFLAVNFLNPHDIMYYTSGPDMTASRASQFPDESVRPPDAPLYRQDLGYEIVGDWGPGTLPGRPDAVQNYDGCYSAAMGRMEMDDSRIAREFQNFYWNCTRDCDRHLAALLDGLEASGEADRTIIVFTADHGEYLGVHGLRGKGVTAYREGSKVPLIICHPDGMKGKAGQALTSHIDIAPTLLSYAGVAQATLAEQIPVLAGHDIGALAGSANTATRRDEDGILTYWTSLAFLDPAAPRILAEALEKKGLSQRIAQISAVQKVDWHKRGQMRGIFDGRWKFSRYFKPSDHHFPAGWEELTARNDLELYDTSADPAERTNLAYDPSYRAEIKRLNARTNALIRTEVGEDRGNFVPMFAR